MQCLVLLPAGSCAVDGLGRCRRLTHGPGWRLLSPLPGSVAYVAARLPVCEGRDGLRARGPVSRFAPTPMPGPGRPLERGADRVEAHGKLVWVGGRPFARAAGKRQARYWVALLSQLAGSESTEARSRLSEAVAASFDLARFEQRRDAFVRATRMLRSVGAAYFAGLFAAAPLCSWWLGGERGLAVALPGLAALHLGALVALARAHRSLLPDERAERAEMWIAATLYPPGLLRGLQDLAIEVFSGFHPAVLACALLDEEDRHRFLRTERARLDRLREQAPAEGLGLAAAELQALVELAESVGETEAGLIAAPTRVDPGARSYCPICLTEYLAAANVCADCGVALRRFDAP